MKKFSETVKKYTLIKKGEKILVGVSGGPDSLTLLLQLVNLKPKMELVLQVAHIDHGLRKNSGTDALFVENLCKRLNIPVNIKKLGQKLVQKKGSLEEICREARLDFLIKTAKKIKADKIALGHNLDDQAETVLMRMLRGTGLSGLSGISVKRKIKGIIFIRPLLETSRSQINKYLKREGIKARLDQTNKEDLFFRNKIRHKLIPFLKNKFNPNIVEVLSNLAQSSSCDYEYLDQAAKRSLRGNNSSLNLKKIIQLHPAILRLKIRQAITCLQGDTRRISFTHIKEIEDLLFNRPTGSIVDLPKGISVQKTYNCLRLYKR
ncbi:MAG: tRNA lysidine(34) synthetase TilS [Candidatus Omnitrophica bacterium]|nr:tRNA lysidine(34) synthetase TilS [Candidatus Omnitrophota bacterium]